MQLFATPLSHFSRKVRILLDHYGLDYEFVNVGNAANAGIELFQGNPVMKVPVLKDGDLWLIESDHIAGYLARTYDPNDRYGVLSTDPMVLNTRAVLNGIMDNEVKLILAERTGLSTAPHAFFQKARTSIEEGMRWLEERAGSFDTGQPGYLEFHLVSLWDHLKHYEMFDLNYPALDAIAATLATRDEINRSAPRK